MTQVMWKCTDCSGVVFGSSGYVGVSYDDLTDEGAPVVWAAWHDACHPDDGIAYDVDVTKVSTVAGILEWTDHLSYKNWYHRSNWRDLMMAEHGIDVAPVEHPPEPLLRMTK